MPEKRHTKEDFFLNLVLRIVLLCVIFVEVLFLVKWEFFRVDLTQDKLYTLTDSTNNLLKNLKKRVLIKGFFTRDVPPQVKPVHERIRDYLDEYQARSGGKVVVEIVDPEDDQTLRDEADRLGIQGIPLGSTSGNQLSLKRVYQGLRIRVGDKQKVLDLSKLVLGAAQSGKVPSQFEYLLTNAISELVMKKKPKILVYAKSQTPPSPFMRNQGVSYKNFKDVFKGRYQVEETELKPETAEDAKIPDDTDLLLVVKPKDFNDKQLFMIDQYLVKGGKAIFFVDEQDFDFGKMWKTDFNTGVEDLLKHYGLNVKKKLVADIVSRLDYPVAQRARIGGQYVPIGYIRVPYPYWVIAAGVDWGKQFKDKYPDALPGMNPDNPAVAKLESALFLWCNPVEPLKKLPPGVKAQVLVRTSPATLTEDIPQSVDPGMDQVGIKQFIAKFNRRFTTEKSSQVPLVAYVTGAFTSYFKGKKLPEFPEGDKNKDEKKDQAASKPASKPASRPASKPAKKKLEWVEKTGKKAQLVVIGDSTFTEDNFFNENNGTLYEGDRALVLNLVDWLALAPDLVELRTRDTKVRLMQVVKPRENETPDQLQARRKRVILFVRVANMFAIPLLLVILGLFIWLWRRARKRSFVQSLG